MTNVNHISERTNERIERQSDDAATSFVEPGEIITEKKSNFFSISYRGLPMSSSGGPSICRTPYNYPYCAKVDSSLIDELHVLCTSVCVCVRLLVGIWICDERLSGCAIIVWYILSGYDCWRKTLTVCAAMKGCKSDDGFWRISKRSHSTSLASPFFFRWTIDWTVRTSRVHL